MCLKGDLRWSTPRIAILIGKIGTLMKIAGVYWYWTMMINIDYYMVEIGVPGTLWQPNSWKAHKSTAYDMDEPCTTCSSMWELSEMGPAVNLSSWPWQATASSMRQGIWQWLWARISPRMGLYLRPDSTLECIPLVLNMEVCVSTWTSRLSSSRFPSIRSYDQKYQKHMPQPKLTCILPQNKSEHRTQSVAAADFSYLMDPDSPPMALAPSLPTQTLESKVFQRLRTAKLQICTQPKCLCFWIDVAEGHRALDLGCKMLVVTRVVHHGASKQPPTVTKWIMV